METFSKTLQHATGFQPIKGDLTGTCCMCGEDTSEGNKKKFGNNFTCADYVSSGDVICPYCQHLVSNSNKYRRTMFLLTEDSFKPFKKKDIKEIIFNLPSDKDYYLYLTKTWQKLGYILMNHARNSAGTKDITCIVDYNIITFTLPDLQEKYELCKQLREYKISKEVLETASFEVHHYRRLNEAYGNIKTRQLINKVENFKNNPVWDLAIYICD